MSLASIKRAVKTGQADKPLRGGRFMLRGTAWIWARLRKHRKRLVQFAEYMVGGGVYFWSGYATFAICYSLFHWDWLIAKMLADVVGWTLNFLIQRYWAFYNPKLARKPAVAWRYIGLTLVNLAIDYTIVALLKALGVTPYVGMFVSALFFTAWNYLWYRFWVFDPKRP